MLTVDIPHACQTEAIPDEWKPTHETIARFRLLEPDWDGLTANPLGNGVADAAVRFARYFEKSGLPVPRVVEIGTNGTIWLEWYAGDKTWSFEVESASEGVLYWWSKGDNRAETVRLRLSVQNLSRESDR